MMIQVKNWFIERELFNQCPKHFVITKTKISNEAYEWIYKKLSGRFCLIYVVEKGQGVYTQNLARYPAFEDKAEAIFYELTWS